MKTGIEPLCRLCTQHRDSNIHLRQYRQLGYHPYVGGSTVFAVDIGGSVIKLDAGIHCEECQGPVLQVTYGQEITKDLSYTKAAAKLGQAIMHALTNQGLLDGQEP